MGMIFKSETLDNYLDLVTYGFTNPMPDAKFGPYKITAKDVINGEINFHTACRTTKDAFDNNLTQKSKPLIGDVLLTKDGTLGRVAVVKVLINLLLFFVQIKMFYQTICIICLVHLYIKGSLLKMLMEQLYNIFILQEWVK